MFQSDQENSAVHIISVHDERRSIVLSCSLIERLLQNLHVHRLIPWSLDPVQHQQEQLGSCNKADVFLLVSCCSRQEEKQQWDLKKTNICCRQIWSWPHWSSPFTLRLQDEWMWRQITTHTEIIFSATHAYQPSMMHLDWSALISNLIRKTTITFTQQRPNGAWWK